MSLDADAVREVIAHIEGSTSDGSRPDAYKQLQAQIFTSSSQSSFCENILLYVTSLLGDSIGIIQSKPIFASLVQRIREINDLRIQIEVGKQVLEQLATRQSAFAEEDFALKSIVADALAEEEDFRGAATVLQSMNLENNDRPLSADEKAKHWIRIMRCYLEEDEPEMAVSQLNRIKAVLPDVNDRDTRITFLVCQARILDSQRNFLDASAKYYETSLQPFVDEADRLRSLSSAIACAILAPAGPRRSAEMAKLYKDERSKGLDEFSIMQKIFLDRLLLPKEAKAFEEKLSEHQSAKTADGSTVLDKAVLENNLLAASRLYRNMHMSQLGQLLGVSADRAEVYAAQMIEQGRLKGSIDLLESIIFFDATGRRELLAERDANIQNIAKKVEALSTTIQEQHPEFYKIGFVQ